MVLLACPRRCWIRTRLQLNRLTNLALYLDGPQKHVVKLRLRRTAPDTPLDAPVQDAAYYGAQLRLKGDDLAARSASGGLRRGESCRAH